MNIWKSIEFEAIKRDFSYKEYLTLHKLEYPSGKAVSLYVYSLLETALYLSMLEDDSK